MKQFKIVALILAVVFIAGIMMIPVGARTVAAPRGGAELRSSLKYEVALSIADSANASIEALVEAAQKNPNADIRVLVVATEAISAMSIMLIRMLGFNAECEYTEYIINGQSVLIDPIIVIKRSWN